jgi:hypothetical protein
LRSTGRRNLWNSTKNVRWRHSERMFCSERWYDASGMNADARR